MIEPIITDGDYECWSPSCNGRITTHRRAVYRKDEQRTCLVCGRSSRWIPVKIDNVKTMEMVEYKDEDSTKDEFDFRRSSDRKYTKRKDKKPWEDE